jgi:hypothetical protein
MSRRIFKHMISEISLKREIGLSRTEYISLSKDEKKDYRKEARKKGFADVWSDDYSQNDLRSMYISNCISCN